MLKTPQQQPRSDQRHQRHRNLRNHQNVVCPVTPRPSSAFAALLQNSREICPQCAERRKQPANNSGSDANCGGERQHFAIHPALPHHSQVRGDKRHQRPQPPHRQQQPNRPAPHRQQQTFRQQLPRQLPRARSQRRSHRHFPLSSRIAHQQQVHDVGAGNQQHQPHRPGKNQQDAPQLRDGWILHRLQEHAKELVRIRILDGFLFVQSLQFVSRLRQRDARLQPRNPVERVMNVFGQVIFILPNGHPKVRPAQKAKIGGQDAHNRIPLVVERDRSAHHLRIAPKSALPKAMTQYHHGRTACPVLFWNEVVASRELYPKHGEQARACVAPQHPLCLTFAGQIESPGELHVCSHLRKARVLFAPVCVVAR